MRVASGVVSSVRGVLRAVPGQKFVNEEEARARGELTWYFGSYESEMGLRGMCYERGELEASESSPSSVFEMVLPDGSHRFIERPEKKDPRNEAWKRGESIRSALGRLSWVHQFALEALFTPGRLPNGRQIIRFATGDEDCGRIGHHSPTLCGLVVEHGSIDAGVAAWEASGKSIWHLWAQVKREVTALKSASIRAYLAERGVSK